MLRDRIVLIEQEIDRQSLICGQMYLKIVTGQNPELAADYEDKLYNLTLLKTEQMVIKQMISEGSL